MKWWKKKEESTYVLETIVKVPKLLLYIQFKNGQTIQTVTDSDNPEFFKELFDDWKTSTRNNISFSKGAVNLAFRRTDIKFMYTTMEYRPATR